MASKYGGQNFLENKKNAYIFKYFCQWQIDSKQIDSKQLFHDCFHGVKQVKTGGIEKHILRRYVY